MKRTPFSNVLSRLISIMMPALGVLTITFFVPPLNPFKLPHIDLTGPFALAAYWVAQSGGKDGMPFIAIAMTALVVSRPGIPGKRRAVEALAILLALTFVLGGGAYLNEHYVKPVFAVARPNMIELATTPPDAPALQMSLEDFYHSLDDAARSAHLKKVLTPDIRLNERIRGHWIAETGYSFPSGHSFSSMMFATFFLAIGISCLSGRRLWVCYILPVWALAVCISRPILRVHSPTDICVGGLEGIVTGILAFLGVYRVFAVLYPEHVASTGQAVHPE